MFGLGGMEVAMLLGIGALLFGKRLPEIGRSSVGRSSPSSGLSDIQDEVETASSRPSMSARSACRARFDGRGDEPASPVI